MGVSVLLRLFISCNEFCNTAYKRPAGHNYPSLCIFYILPKIHKSCDDTLPIGYQGRPIVSACNLHTDHVSKYIDYILKPHMQSLPSYVKDTTDFITKLKQFQVTSQKTYLVTLDVSSLYTNIPHEDGIEACQYFLENNGHSSGSLSIDNVCSLIELVLKNNYFKFNNICYRQRKGTAMGSSMAPAYASLFMGKFEMDFMKICSEKPTLWLRFLDDIFMVWTHSLDKLHEFIKCLNNFHPYIKFTYDISETKVSFLDVDILLQNNYISISIHIKSTNIHQQLSIHHVIPGRVRMAFLTVKQNATGGLCLKIQIFQML